MGNKLTPRVPSNLIVQQHLQRTNKEQAYGGLIAEAVEAEVAVTLAVVEVEFNEVASRLLFVEVV